MLANWAVHRRYVRYPHFIHVHPVLGLYDTVLSDRIFEYLSFGHTDPFLVGLDGLFGLGVVLVSTLPPTSVVWRNSRIY